MGIAHRFSSNAMRAGQTGEHVVEAGYLRASDCATSELAMVRVRSNSASIVEYDDGGPRAVQIADQNPLSEFAVSGRSTFSLMAHASGTAQVTSSVDVQGQTLEHSSQLRVT